MPSRRDSIRWQVVDVLQAFRLSETVIHLRRDSFAILLILGKMDGFVWLALLGRKIRQDDTIQASAMANCL